MWRAFVAITIGVIVWQLRPDSRTGILLTAWPFAALLADLRIVFSGSRSAVTIGYATNWLVVPIFAHLVLSYPTGRLRSGSTGRSSRSRTRSRPSYGLVAVLFFDPRPQCDGTITVVRAPCGADHARSPARRRRASRRARPVAAPPRPCSSSHCSPASSCGRRRARVASSCPSPSRRGSSRSSSSSSSRSSAGRSTRTRRRHPVWFWIVTAAALAIPRGAGRRPAVGPARPRGRRRPRRRARAHAARARFATRSRGRSATRRSSWRSGCPSAGYVDASGRVSSSRRRGRTAR